MVLCMIPASFAATVSSRENISNKTYDIVVLDWNNKTNGTGAQLGDAQDANSVSVEYNYEDLDEDVTGMFTEDYKMALVRVEGFREDLTDAEVTIDGKKIEVNELAAYDVQTGYLDRGDEGWVIFPIRLTKNGFSDTYLVELTGTYTVQDGDDTKKEVTYTETAEISVICENTAAYKNAKTAYISSISSNSPLYMDAYIVGDRIYFDFFGEKDFVRDQWFGHTVDITFADSNHDAFD